MIEIILNNAHFGINSFSRNTYFNGNTIESNAYFDVTNFSDAVATIHSLVDVPITTLLIKKGDQTIYDAGEINARITNLNESLSGEQMLSNVNIRFD